MVNSEEVFGKAAPCPRTDLRRSGDCLGNFLLFAICKLPFRGMKKVSLLTGWVEVTSLHGIIYENAVYSFFWWRNLLEYDKRCVSFCTEGEHL